MADGTVNPWRTGVLAFAGALVVLLAGYGVVQLLSEPDASEVSSEAPPSEGSPASTPAAATEPTGPSPELCAAVARWNALPFDSVERSTAWGDVAAEAVTASDQVKGWVADISVAYMESTLATDVGVQEGIEAYNESGSLDDAVDAMGGQTAEASEALIASVGQLLDTC